MSKIIAFLYFIVLAQLGSSQIDIELTSQLQNELDNCVVNKENHGVSAFLIMPDGQTWSGNAGVGKSNIAITDTTLFHGASTTKMNISILLLLLAEDELVDLDASWIEYVTLDVAFDPSITIRQLLNHTSGIKDYLETASSGNDITSDFNKFYSPQEILEDIVSSTPDFSVGTGFQYSNSNYALAALIAESVTENSLVDELKNRIWAPLGMHHTYFGGHEEYTEPTAGIWWNFGNGITDYSDYPTTSILSYAYGAGNIVTCPRDLAFLLSGVINGQLLSVTSLDEMKHFVPNSFESWTAGYGLGIHHFNQQDDEVIGHDGYYTNLTDMFYSTNCGFTLVTMTNTQTSWFGIFNSMYDKVTEYCLSTEVENVEIDDQFVIYPNPSSDIIKIKSENEIIELQLKGITGETILYSSPNQKEVLINVNYAGIYFLTLKSTKAVITNKIIIK